MSKKGSYLGGHSVFTIKKKNKSKVATGTIVKSKSNWPYKTGSPEVFQQLGSTSSEQIKPFTTLKVSYPF